MVASPWVLDKQGLGCSSPSLQKRPHKEPLSAPLEPIQWEMGQVSLPALLVELAVATKQVTAMEQQGAMACQARAGLGGLVGASLASHSHATAPAPTPPAGGSPSLVPREGQKPETVEKKKYPKAPAVGFLHFWAFVGQCVTCKGRARACSHHVACSRAKGTISDDATLFSMASCPPGLSKSPQITLPTQTQPT